MTYINNKPANNIRAADFDYKCPLSVHFTHMALAKLRAYIANVENEVGGLGQVTYNAEKNLFLITDIYLIEQTVSAASTLLSPEGLMKFYNERTQINPADDYSQYKLWWHSHYNFQTFWSGTDEATIESLDQETPENNWFLSVVGNQAGSMIARLDVYSPFRFTRNNIPIFKEEYPSEVEEMVKADIEAKVKTIRVVNTYPPAITAGKQYDLYGNPLNTRKGSYLDQYDDIYDHLPEETLEPVDDIIDRILLKEGHAKHKRGKASGNSRSK